MPRYFFLTDIFKKFFIYYNKLFKNISCRRVKAENVVI